MASTLKEALELTGFKATSLFNLPEDPVRNLDLDAHGRNTAAEACVVTVAMFPDESYEPRSAGVVAVEKGWLMKKYENLMLCACLCSCHLWPLFNVGLVSLILLIQRLRCVCDFRLANEKLVTLSRYLETISINLFLCCCWF